MPLSTAAENRRSPIGTHPEGLAHDLPHLLGRLPVPGAIGRRQALRALGGFSLVAVAAACGSSTTPSAEGAATTTASTAGGGQGTVAAVGPGGEIPDETAGPFPGDGSNGPNVLTESGIVRRDIRSSFGSSSTTAQGVPLTIELTVVDAASGEVKPGAAVYLWHCDAVGGYSIYSAGLESENYLRGVQETGTDGTLVFESIFPGCYPGRWPHAHFEVYESLAVATTGSQAIKTSQLALPEDVSAVVYGDASGYDSSTGNLGQLSLDSDNVFSDGWADQLAATDGSVDGGYSATLTVRV